MSYVYYREPSPHAYIPQLIAPAQFEQLVFPCLQERPQGRTGWDLFSGEPEWQNVIRSPGWRELAGRFLSESALHSIIGLFAADMRRLGCLVDPDKAYLQCCDESPTDLQVQTLQGAHDPNALFFRFDLHATAKPTWEFVHCDWPRRVVGGLLFLSDAAEEGMEGGAFGLFSDQDYRGDRISRSPVLVKRFPFIANQGVLLLNCNTAFHGPQRIQHILGSRRWVYFSISSRCDVWPISLVTSAER